MSMLPVVTSFRDKNGRKYFSPDLFRKEHERFEKWVDELLINDEETWLFGVFRWFLQRSIMIIIVMMMMMVMMVAMMVIMFVVLIGGYLVQIGDKLWPILLDIGQSVELKRIETGRRVFV